MKKWISLLLAVALFGIILFFYISFNGNFISKSIAKGIVRDYVAQTYKGKNVQLTDSAYNFKDGQYIFHYEIYNNGMPTNYSFSVGGPFIPKGRVVGYLSYESTDEVLKNTFEQAGIKWLQEQLRANNIAFDSIGYDVSVPKGFYTDGAAWQPDVDPQLMPWILIELTDERQTEQQFLQQAEQIRQLLNEQHMTYTEVQVSITREYDNRDGAREGYAPIYYEGLYSTRFTPDTKVIK